MNKGFHWVPFYNEMAQKLLGYRNKQLDAYSLKTTIWFCKRTSC
jgi:hypothetical protein